MFVDSHCHLSFLNLETHQGQLSSVIEQAQAAGVLHMLTVSTKLEHAPELIALAERYACVSASVGVHPSESTEQPLTVDQLVELANHPRVVAIGETGLDYHYNDTGHEDMRDRFRCHIEAAKQLGKPLIIHTRAAKKDTLDIMSSCQAEQAGGVMHCFTEDWGMAKSALDMGFYISISGIVTFKKAEQVAQVAQQVPLDRLLIETDSPYLAPVPHRGKQNEPKFVSLVAEKIAQLRNCSVEEIAQCSRDNFTQLFGVEVCYPL